MTTANEKKEQMTQDDSTADFHGAAIINSDGQEVPITEEMVKQACEELEENRKKS